MSAVHRPGVVIPETFIQDDRFHALIRRLRAIDGPDDEARDKAIHYALVQTGRVAPESWRSFYE
ncbi:hypothetical protein J2045_002149 [Peteryoungia aggregata LMG 23059]|uniref:Uncharacterized protein n=1 Tax=Peteryoungia aggregata LMG 23059 TaxID=1368425 RepID=A0ABU0G729_9HYPH|nr:hypothetical protein [Peteryoungia aggregata LMG 23059]